MSAARFTRIVETAAGACTGMAEHLEAGRVPGVACIDLALRSLVAVPLTHPVRVEQDRALTSARELENGTATAAALRALAGELRAGVPAMLRTGWTATFSRQEDADAP